jgi:hypothetical protein
MPSFGIGIEDRQPTRARHHARSGEWTLESSLQTYLLFFTKSSETAAPHVFALFSPLPVKPVLMNSTNAAKV